jgi:outer membrane protein insertion porin family
LTKAFTLFVLFLLCAFPALARAAEAEENRTTASRYVGKIHFSGNKAISEEELRLIIGTSEKRSFLGLGLFGGSGKPFNAEEFEKDLFLIKKLYTYKGFFFAEVDTTIARHQDPRKRTIKS